ncbi:hypothetical protein [Streptomyces sp. NPDC004685]
MLTVRLLPLLLAAPAPRVAMMSSGTANRARIDFSDLPATRSYSPTRAYAQSKLADATSRLHPHARGSQLLGVSERRFRICQ